LIKFGFNWKHHKLKRAFKAIHRYKKVDVVIPIYFDKTSEFDGVLLNFKSVLGLAKDADQQSIINALALKTHPLIFADSYENVQSSSLFGTMTTFFKSVPKNTTVLFTSRSRSNLAGEKPCEVKDLLDETGANFFVRYAQTYFVDEPPNELKEKLKAISSKTGGHPLAIEILAASYHGSTSEIDRMIEALPNRVDNSKEERHKSLESSFKVLSCNNPNVQDQTM